jgi:hypothetical protein
MAVMGAVAMSSTGRIAQNLARWSPRVVFSGIAFSVAALMTWNLVHYFGPRDTRLYGDTNSLVATELGRELRSLPEGATVYLLGLPRMSYGGFQSLAFLARGARGVDISEPLTESTPRPVVSGPTVFAALPERMRELELAQRWFPGGELKEIRERGRDPILWTYSLTAGAR